MSASVRVLICLVLQQLREAKLADLDARAAAAANARESFVEGLRTSDAAAPLVANAATTGAGDASRGV